MKKVSVKFNKSGRWAVSNTQQFDVTEGEVVNDLPLNFAAIVVDAGKGEVVDREESKPEAKVEKQVDEGKEVVTACLFSYTELNSLDMPALRNIGEKFEVKGSKKDELADKILDAQTYIPEYLDSLEDIDLCELARVRGFDAELEDPENLTEQETEGLVSGILISQDDGPE